MWHQLFDNHYAAVRTISSSSSETVATIRAKALSGMGLLSSGGVRVGEMEARREFLAIVEQRNSAGAMRLLVHDRRVPHLDDDLSFLKQVEGVPFQILILHSIIEAFKYPFSQGGLRSMQVVLASTSAGLYPL